MDGSTIVARENYGPVSIIIVHLTPRLTPATLPVTTGVAGTYTTANLPPPQLTTAWYAKEAGINSGSEGHCRECLALLGYDPLVP